MTPSVDHSPPRRPIFFPVVIATVFLTIIGMAGGYLLSQRHRDDGSRAAPQPSQPISFSSSPAPTINGVACPDPAQEEAAKMGYSLLRQVLKIETKNLNTVWICEDPNGNLFYQSLTPIHGQVVPLVENVTGLFLAGVTRDQDGAGYHVVDLKKNQFEITKKHLLIRFAATGETQESEVVRSQ